MSAVGIYKCFYIRLNISVFICDMRIVLEYCMGMWTLIAVVATTFFAGMVMGILSVRIKYRQYQMKKIKEMPIKDLEKEMKNEDHNIQPIKSEGGQRT